MAVIRQRLAELLVERQRLEEQRLLHLQRIDALRDMIGKLKGGDMPDGEDLDLQLRLALYGIGEIGDSMPWETDPSWLAVQMPGWSYRLAVCMSGLRCLPPRCHAALTSIFRVACACSVGTVGCVYTHGAPWRPGRVCTGARCHLPGN